MEDVPTIWDFLAHQSGDTGFSMLDYDNMLPEDKEGKIGSYLQNLLLESGKFEDSDDIESIFKTFAEGKGFKGFNIEDIYRSKDFQNMSRDDMENWLFENMVRSDDTLGTWDERFKEYDISQIYDKIGNVENVKKLHNPKMYDLWRDSQFESAFTEGEKDKLFDFLQGMQEGFSSMKTFGEYGGVDKIRDIEKSTQSDISSAYSKYIPREIKSRYGRWTMVEKCRRCY